MKLKNNHDYNLKQLENLDNLTLAEKEELVDEVIRWDFDGSDEYSPLISENQIKILKEFVNERYEKKNAYAQYAKLYGYRNWKTEDKHKLAYLIVDLRDFALRVIYDEIECTIKASGIEDSTEYLLRSLYECKSNNDYDYNFLFETMDKEKFVNYACSQIQHLSYIDGQLLRITGR